IYEFDFSLDQESLDKIWCNLCHVVLDPDDPDVQKFDSFLHFVNFHYESQNHKNLLELEMSKRLKFNEPKFSIVLNAINEGIITEIPENQTGAKSKVRCNACELNINDSFNTISIHLKNENHLKNLQNSTNLSNQVIQFVNQNEYYSIKD